MSTATFLPSFAALKDAVATVGGGRSFGATVESFQQSGSTFAPATIARLQDQLKVAGGYSAKTFQFEWSYMTRNGQQLYNDYRNLHLPPGP